MLLLWLPSDGDGLTTYTISYTYEGICSDFTGSYVPKMSNSSNCIIEDLKPFSTYAVTVMATREDQVAESSCTIVTPSTGMTLS